MNQEPTPRQQASEALRQAESILVTTAQHPTVDQTAAAIAMAMVLRKIGKKATAVISDSLPQTTAWMPTSELATGLSGSRDFILKVDLAKAEVDKLKYTIEEGKLNIHVSPFKGGFAPSDVSFGYGNYHYDLIVVLGVPARSRLDRIFETNPELLEVPIINLDFHRSNENYGAVNVIEPAAASLSEILLAMGESLQQGVVDEQIATVMLAGIMSATERFTAVHTTSKSLTVAAQLMAAGANQPAVVKGLYRRNEGYKPDAAPSQAIAQQPTTTQAPAAPVPEPTTPQQLENTPVQRASTEPGI